MINDINYKFESLTAFGDNMQYYTQNNTNTLTVSQGKVHMY